METRKKRVVTLGEVMMRLSPPGYAKFSQATSLDLAYGGGEANVAISLAYLGLDACHVTRFPDNLIGKAATQYLRHHWIDTSEILYGDQHMGKYFLERGAVHRSSEIVYERDASAFCKIDPESLDWYKILDGADWFHWTGITPAISEGAYRVCKDAIAVANELGVSVSADIHSRKNMWQYGKGLHEIMPELIAGCDVLIASGYDIREVFGFENEESEAQLMKRLNDAFPRVKKVFDKTRETVSASHNRIQGKLWNGDGFVKTEFLDVTHIIDRVGTGDAYAAGLIYGLLHYVRDAEVLQFATAACALKHTIEGDANMVSLDNVLQLVSGDTSGSIIR